MGECMGRPGRWGEVGHQLSGPGLGTVTVTTFWGLGGTDEPWGGRWHCPCHSKGTDGGLPGCAPLSTTVKWVHLPPSSLTGLGEPGARIVVGGREVRSQITGSQRVACGRCNMLKVVTADFQVSPLEATWSCRPLPSRGLAAAWGGDGGLCHLLHTPG